MKYPILERIAMSKKFEQLLDYLVNEEMDKANELFHTIVVEKSREIYENLIAEEDHEEYYDKEGNVDPDGCYDADGNHMPERAMQEQEDSYGTQDEIGGDAADDFISDVEMDNDEQEESDGHESDESSAIFDIKNAISQLEAAFAELESAQDSEEDEFDGEDDEESEESDEDEGMDQDDMRMGQPAFEGRRVTREYVEKVGNDWDKNSQKMQGQYAGAGTGDRQSAPKEGASPVSSGKGKPVSGANAKNLNSGGVEGQSNTGTSPGKVNRGITPEKSEQYTGKDWETNSSPNGKAGVKNLSKVAATGKTPGPVGSGTGDIAGQTSQSQDKPFLKKL
jgi:hypothetical protein